MTNSKRAIGGETDSSSLRGLWVNRNEAAKRLRGQGAVRTGIRKKRFPGKVTVLRAAILGVLAATAVSPAYAFTMSSSDYPDTVVDVNQISDQLVIASDTNIVAKVNEQEDGYPTINLYLNNEVDLGTNSYFRATTIYAGTAEGQQSILNASGLTTNGNVTVQDSSNTLITSVLTDTGLAVTDGTTTTSVSDSGVFVGDSNSLTTANGLTATAATISGALSAGSATIGTLSISSDGKITNLGSGTIGSGSTDGVNGGDVYSYLTSNYTTTADSGWTVSVGGSTYKVAQNGTLTLATSGSNLSAALATDTGTVTLSFSDTPTFTSVTVGSSADSQATLASTGLTLGTGLIYSSGSSTTPVIGSGNQVVAGGTNSLVIGNNNTVGYYNSSVDNLILIGSGFSTNSTGSVIISPTGGTYAGIDHVVVIGANAVATSGQATSVGYGASSGEGSAAFGYNAVSTTYGLAMGYDSQAGSTVSNSDGTSTINGFSVAFGTEAKATGDSSTAIGYGTSAGYDGAIALGRGAAANAAGAIAIGRDSSAGAADSVALGIGSYTVTAAGVQGYDPAGENTSGSTWVSTKGAVSVGASGSGFTRQITNVAAGSEDTDAVNVAQLKDSNITFAGDTGTASMVKNANTVTIQGGASDTATATTGNITVASDSGTLTVALVQNVDLGASGTVLAGTSTAGSTLSSTGLSVTSDGTAANTAALSASGLTIGTGTNALTSSGLTATSASIGTLSISSDGKITNLASGTTGIAEDSTDAVNGGDVWQYLQDNNGWDLAVGSSTYSVGADGKVTLVSSSSNLGVALSTDTGTVTFSFSDTPTFTSVTTGSTSTGTTTLSSTGLIFSNGMVYTSAGETVPVIGYGNTVASGTTNTIVIGNSNTVTAATSGTTDFVAIGNNITTNATQSVIISPSTADVSHGSFGARGDW